LDHFENVLHNPVGIDYFFKYLEENSSEVHLLALYIDLRLYESSARKKRQFEKTVQQETQEDRVGNSVVSS
jgi:acetylglutamate synthase